MRRPVRRLVLLAAALTASSLSCGRDVTGPGARGRLSGPLSFAAEFPAAVRAPGGGLSSLVAFERVRVVFRNATGSIVFDKAFDFTESDDSLAITLNVPVSSSAPESGELLQFSLYYVDAANDTVFTGGPTAVAVKSSKPGDPPPAPIGVVLRYTGPGEEAVRVVLSPASATLVAGQTQTFTTQAFDQFNTPVTAPVIFASTDTTVVTVSATGVATARNRRASAFVIAKLFSDQADTAAVSVSLPASRMIASSGNAQSGAAGTTLAQNVVVLVTASDSVPVSGVAVTFAATAGGAPGATTVNTDASGFASTSWTLGNTVGTQTMTATVNGLTGSPVSFTATATPGIPSSLVFTTQPSTVVAGAAITPAVVVEARTTGGSLAVGYTDSVTVAIGTNPATGTLGGTRTVAAVNGIATFAGLTLDKAGNGYTLVATSGALTAATSGVFNVTPGAATAVAFVVQPAGGTPGLALAPSPVVRAVDALGNPATFAGNITLSIGANPGGAILGGTTTRAAVANVSTFDDITLSATGTGFTLVAAATGLTGVTSAAFNIGAQTISWINPAGGAWSVATNWNLNRVPNASDVVEISLNGTYSVNLDVNPNVAGIVLGMSASGTQTLQATSRTLTLAGNLQVGANGGVNLISSSILGTGTVVNEGAFLQYNSTIALTMDNQSLLLVSASSSQTGPLLNAPGAVLRVAQVDGCCSTASLTVSNGFTNQGTIELSNGFTSAFNSQLTVTNGTLVNAAGATIASLGGLTPGGARDLAAQLDNQGLLTVEAPLTLNRASSVHQNSGLIDLTAGNLAVVQSGGGASFTNTGTVNVPVGRVFGVQSGSLNLAAGGITGAGTLGLSNVSAAFATPFSNAVLTLAISGTTVNGPGTVTVSSGRTLTLYSSTVNAPLVNEGTLVATGSSLIGGSFSSVAGSTLRVMQVDGCCGTATLTFASGFTNQGVIELSNQFNQPYGAQLTVSTGTLVNAPGASIAALGGQTPGGARTLSAELNNQGTVSLEVPLTINRASSAHANSGTIDLTVADLSVPMSGGGASFTNTGTIALGTGRTWSLSNGSLSLASGTLSGAGTLALTNITAALASGFSNSVTQISIIGSTINGPGTLTNAAGRTLTLFSSTVNAPFVNDGTLLSSGSSVVNGTFANAAGATMRVLQLDGCCGTATLTFANGFTNLGLIELSNQFNQPYGAQLTVNGGALVNAPAATIAVLGGQTPGGARGLSAELDNQGTVSLEVPLTINRASSAHLNSGLIDVTVADLTVSQSGGGAAFTNTGTITLAAGRTFTVSNGSVNQVSGTLGGAGTLTLVSTTAAFSTPLTNAAMQINLIGTTLNGPATLTNAAGRTLTLFSSTINAPMVNDGLLISSGSSIINGSFAQSAAAVVRVAQLDGCCGVATLTYANGFTNNGTIELSNQFNQPYGAQLTVNNGTLVNVAGATIASIGGQTPGGSRSLSAQLDNQGTVTVAVPLTINRASSAHLNSGVIDATAADLSIFQSGGGASFTNTGTLTVGAGRTLLLSGGSFAQSAGTFGGVGTITLQSMTISFATPFTNAVTQLNVSGSTINGTATVTNAAGRNLTLLSSTVNAPFVNDGLLISSGSSVIGGTFSNSAGATVRVAQLDGCCGTATLTYVNGFTNNGTIELSNQFTTAYGADLTVTNGTLVNASGAVITAIGGQTPGGNRALNAQLDNQGTVTLAVPMSIGRASSAHLNSGLIDLIGGSLTVNQSGGGASFTNNGTISVGAGRVLGVSGGTFATGAGASLGGAGGLSFVNATSSFADVTPVVASIALSGGTATFAQATGTATTTWILAGTTLNGAAAFTNAVGQSLSLNSVTFNAPLVNQGTLVTSGSSFFGGAFSNAPGATVRVAQLDGCCGSANLTIANGFINQGLIELSNQFTVAYNAQLSVTTGTLVNAAGATIAALGGQTPGGSRTLTATLDNQGTLTIATPLVINGVSSDHVNTGLIDMTAANLTITQGGTTPTFTNSGTISLAPGRTLSVSIGVFTSDATGTIGGGGTIALSSLAANFTGAPPSVDAFSAAGSTLNFAQAVNTAVTPLSLFGSTVNGAQPLTNTVGRLLVLDASTLAMPLVNNGTIFASGSTQINGGMTTSPSSVIRIGQINGSSSFAVLTFANGFANNGQIELTTAFAAAYSARLAITSGEFLNTATGVVSTSDGLSAGGTREIVASGGVNNQGVLRIGNGTAGRLTITAPFQTSGFVEIELGGATIATQYDHLQIIGSATFGGALNVTLINGFTPGVGQTFTPISYTSGSGTFGNYFLPPSIVNPPAVGATALTLTGQ